MYSFSLFFLCLNQVNPRFLGKMNLFSVLVFFCLFFFLSMNIAIEAGLALIKERKESSHVFKKKNTVSLCVAPD